MISGFLNVSFKANYFMFGDTGPLWKNQEQSPIVFEQNHFIHLHILESYNFQSCGQDGRRQIPTTRLINSWKSWIWDQYLPENMKWKFGKSLELWNQETLKPTESLKPRHPLPLNIPTSTPAPNLFWGLALGQFLITLVALDLGLIIGVFSRLPWCHPKSWVLVPTWRVVIGLVPRP